MKVFELRVTNEFVFGQDYIAVRGDWRHRWYIYLVTEALAHDCGWLWRCDSKESAIVLVKMLDHYKSKSRLAATGTDSVCNPVEPPDVGGALK